MASTITVSGIKISKIDYSIMILPEISLQVWGEDTGGSFAHATYASFAEEL
jgi:hypothetical protein